MNEEKRQKVMLAVFAVCVLGAGGIWAALHDWSGSGSASANKPTAQRVKRNLVKKEEPTRVRREIRGKVEAKPRKVREIAKRGDPERRKRTKKRGDNKIKKKKIVPVS